MSPSPISERQRKEYSPKVEGSLETEFPEIYARIRKIAFELINEHGYEHQEIEFTFESGEADGLYLLQTRPLRHTRTGDLKIFAHPEKLEKHLLGSGIGVSGGAMSGRVAFSEADVERLRATHPDERVILHATRHGARGHRRGALGGRSAHRPRWFHIARGGDRQASRQVLRGQLQGSDGGHGEQCRAGSARTPILAGDQISIDGYSGQVWAGEHEIAGARDPVRLI